MNRREALFSFGAAASAAAATALAAELDGPPEGTAMTADGLPKPPASGFQVLTDPTARATLKAAFDRLIPADGHGPSASDAGCIEFLDGQLAGPYGAGAAFYLQGPLGPGAEAEVMGQKQFLATPRERYAQGLAALEAYAQRIEGKEFAALPPARLDAILTGLENGAIDLGSDVDGKAFFELMLQNVREGYLADPVYGGNRDMAGWKMIGFPGARYDYRPYVERHHQNLGLTPVSLVPQD